MERAAQMVVLFAIAIATIAMYAISMRANYLYGYAIGQSEETRFTIGWANVAADLWKGFGLIVAAALWRTGSRRAAAVIFATWLMCLCFSVSSAIGIYVQERTVLMSGREAQHASFVETERELRDIEATLASRTSRGSTAQVEASISEVLARPIVSDGRVRGTAATLSANCSRHDPRTAAACAEVARMKIQLAEAIETSRLEERARSIRSMLSALRGRGSASAPDPVGEFWSWLSRGLVNVRDVSFGLPLGFALMIEMVSAFGPLGIVSYAHATRALPRRDLSRHDATIRDTTRLAATRRDAEGAEPIGTDHVVAYIAERTEPVNGGGGISVGEIFADYQSWAAHHLARALSNAEFARAFDYVRASPELGGTIRKFGDRYFGIAPISAEGRARARS